MNPSTLLRPIAAAAALALVCILPAGAGAASGGSQMKVLPKIVKIACVKDCAGKKGARKVRAGSTIRLTGDDLDAAAKIVFLGSRGNADDAIAAPLSAKTRVLTVRVPADSATGPIAALTSAGDRSKATKIVSILPQPPVIGTPDLRPVASNLPGVLLETGTSTPRTVFLGAKNLVRFSLRASGPGEKTAAVTLTRQSTGETVANWSVPLPDGQVVSVDWDGTIAGKTAATGRYAFSASLSAADLAVPASAQPAAAGDPNANAFDVYGFVFPIRGKHNYGIGAGRFGGGRGHQGQDIMAKCGVKLVAARGGTVVESRFQSAAGNFIVIRPDAPGVGDQAYMHMPVKSPFNKGDRVYTGQPIGTVGRTGRASACHLHFEQWTGKIWASRPVDPLADLKAWDLVS